MRVAFINYVWDPDLPTAEAVLDRFFTLTDWAEAVNQAGASRVTVFQRFRANATLDRHGIQYQFWPDGGRAAPSFWSAGAAPLHAAVASGGFDVVHVNGVLHPRRVRILRATLPDRTALVVQDHGGVDPEFLSFWNRAWIRRGLSAADALLMSAPGHIQQWRRFHAMPQTLETFDVMESSTRLAAIPRDVARERSGVDGSPALLWVGRLNSNKDPLTVLRGAAAFFADWPAARLTMVYASGDLGAEVRREIARDPVLASRVRLAGRIARADMAAYFSAADLFVLGSHREGSGYAAIEALACGVLPVLTDIPSFRTLTSEGADGVLWQAGDAGSLTRALAAAARAAGDAQREACRAAFEEHFAWPAIGRRALAIYEEVARSRPRAT